MVGLNPFRQLSQGRSECFETAAVGALLSIGAIHQAPPTERDDWRAEAETVAGTTFGSEAAVKTMHARCFDVCAKW